MVGVVLALSAVLPASESYSQFAAAGKQSFSRTLGASSSQKQRSELQVQLASTRANEFRDALTVLDHLDEPGTLDVWRTALSNADPNLQREAWQRYQMVQAELNRKEYVPQIALIKASEAEVLRFAKSAGLEVSIWSASTGQTVAAAPTYLIESLQSAGVDTRVIYASVVDWQRARANGDAVAESITPQYQSASADSASQIGVAVIEETTPSGQTDWLGDRENILMREGSLIAYLDIFPSDGSRRSIDSHLTKRYTGRGYKLIGFYTPKEFAVIASQFFPGKNFEAGRRAKHEPLGGVRMALANGRFHSYEQTLAEFKALAMSYPALARYSKLGSSFEGRDIFALKISKDVAVDDTSKPDILITGLHHAREWISVESPVYVANQLLSAYSTDNSIKYLIDHLQVWIVPIVNPDGLNYSQGSPNDSADAVRLWRKNRRPVSIGCASSVGVDLNRNYVYRWRLQGDTQCVDYCSPNRNCINDDVGASDDPVSELYRGAHPESELEIKAIKSLVDDPNRRFRAQIDYHNYSQLILYPWGYTYSGTSDAPILASLGQQMSDAIFAVDGFRYQPAQGAVGLYIMTGSSTDYAYAVNHVPAPFVIEVRPGCCDFTVPESDIEVVNRENWAGVLPLLNWVAEVGNNNAQSTSTLYKETCTYSAPGNPPSTPETWLPIGAGSFGVPGQPYLVKVTMKNTGANQWDRNNFSLGSTWEPVTIQFPPGTQSVEQDQSVTFEFTVTRPSTFPGPFNYQWQMKGPNGFFGAKTLNAVVPAGSWLCSAPAQSFATFVSQTVTSPMFAGKSYPVSITLNNSGSIPWVAGNYNLGSQSPQDNTNWGASRIAIPTSVPPGANVTFNFNVTAPATPGTCNFQWMMVQDGGAGWFGALTEGLSIKVKKKKPLRRSNADSLHFFPTGKRRH